MNSLMVIAPYKHLGMWVFDDERKGLTQEPFIAGSNRLWHFEFGCPGSTQQAECGCNACTSPIVRTLG